MGMLPRAASAALVLLALAVNAQSFEGSRVRVTGVPLGSGVPVAAGVPSSSYADHIAAGDYHVPNYLPGYPTAATLWPRVWHLPCKRDPADGDLLCAGYGVSPLRGEYIYNRPVLEVVPTGSPRETVPITPALPPPRPAPPVRKRPLG